MKLFYGSNKTEAVLVSDKIEDTTVAMSVVNEDLRKRGFSPYRITVNTNDEDGVRIYTYDYGSYSKFYFLF